MVGRAVLITGAQGGIGSAVAGAFAATGDSLLLADFVDAQPGLESELLKAGAKSVSSVRCDVANEQDAVGAVDACFDRLGGLDVLVNAAGAMIYKPISELTAAEWHASLAVNLIGTAVFVREAMRRMKPGGSIINIASVHAKRTTALVAPYAAAKAGLVSLSRSAAIEGKPLGIRVNAILPGAIDTPMLRDSPTIKSGEEKLDPADVGQPEDVAALAHFLASDAAKFISGTEVVADGGRMGKL